MDGDKAETHFKQKLLPAFRRLIYFGATASANEVNEWNEQLAVLNADIRKTGANVIIGVTNAKQDWSERLAQA